MSYETNLPFGFDFGYEVLHGHDRLRRRIATFRTVDRLGFVGACIANGLDTERLIEHKVDQLSSPLLFGVRQVLNLGEGANKKTKLWQRDRDGQYALTNFGQELVEPNIEFHGSVHAS